MARNINKERLELISKQLDISRKEYEKAIKEYEAAVKSIESVELPEGGFKRISYTDKEGVQQSRVLVLGLDPNKVEDRLNAAIDAIGNVAGLAELKKPDPTGNRLSKAFVTAYQKLDDVFSATGATSLAIEVRKLKIEAKSITHPERSRLEKLGDFLLQALLSFAKFIFDLRVKMTKGAYYAGEKMQTAYDRFKRRKSSEKPDEKPAEKLDEKPGEKPSPQ
jgi:hypothetical protein